MLNVGGRIHNHIPNLISLFCSYLPQNCTINLVDLFCGAWCDPRFVSLDMARLNRAYQIQARRKWGGRLGIQKWLEVRRWKCPPCDWFLMHPGPNFWRLPPTLEIDSSCNLNLSGTFLRQTSYGRHVTDISQLLYVCYAKLFQHT